MFPGTGSSGNTTGGFGGFGGFSNPFGGGDPVGSAFGNIYSMFGSPNASTGIPGDTRSSVPPGTSGTFMGQPFTGGYSGGFGAYGSNPQPISGADNSLTAAQRGASNLAGVMAPTLFQTGGNLIDTGMGVAGGGLGVMGGGLDVMGQSLAALNPAASLYSGILSGNPGVMTQVAAPMAANLSTVESGALNQTGQGMPQGGARAAIMAGLPQAQASQVGNYMLGQLMPAAAGMQQIAQEGAGIGQGMAGVGQGMAGVGTNILGEGGNLASAGLQGELNLYNALLNKQNINQQSTPLTAFDQFASGVANLAGAAGGLATGLGNLGWKPLAPQGQA